MQIGKKIIVIFLFFCTGCGYHFGPGKIPQFPKTISIPFVEGDDGGALTSQLIEQIVQSGEYEYQNSGGAFLLKIKLIDFNEENIGFRYDRKKDGRRRKAIIPTEARLTAIAEVALIEACSGVALIGPVVINASIEFDHNYYLGRGEVNVFSLGQLSDYDTAREAADKPLNRALARKIVDLITDSW